MEWLAPGEALFVLTDEKERSFFAPLAQHFELLFLSDFEAAAGLDDLDPNSMGMVSLSHGVQTRDKKKKKRPLSLFLFSHQGARGRRIESSFSLPRDCREEEEEAEDQRDQQDQDQEEDSLSPSLSLSLSRHARARTQVEQLVAAAPPSRTFTGTFFSTFSSYVARLRACQCPTTVPIWNSLQF